MKSKIRKWLLNYLFHGYFVSLVIINIYYIIKFGELNFSWQILRGNFLFCLIVMPLSLGFKGLFKDFKELWINGSVGQRIIIILGWILLLYGFYSRIK